MRQIAHHIYIKELLDGEYEEKEGWEPNIVHTARGTVSRVNIIGTMLSLGGQHVLDDGTAQVPLRTFEEVPGFSSAKTGDAVIIIGRPRLYQEKFFLIPEVVRIIDARWASVRKKELGEIRSYEKKLLPKPEQKQEVPTPQKNENNAERIITIIDGLDTGDGVGIDKVIAEAKLEFAEAIIQQLILDGDIFEIRPGIVKVL